MTFLCTMVSSCATVSFIHHNPLMHHGILMCHIFKLFKVNLLSLVIHFSIIYVTFLLMPLLIHITPLICHNQVGHLIYSTWKLIWTKSLLYMMTVLCATISFIHHKPLMRHGILVHHIFRLFNYFMFPPFKIQQVCRGDYTCSRWWSTCSMYYF